MIQTGERLPDAQLFRLGSAGPETVSVADFCRGRKVVLFAVPGAFTPTCNDVHLPSFVEHAEALRAKGVDEIACVAVNDPFVLDAWAKATGAQGRVTMLSDGNGAFTRAIGMAFDGSGFGLGERSKRYAMVVEDGTLTTLAVEDNPGACEVTRGAALLEKL